MIFVWPGQTCLKQTVSLKLVFFGVRGSLNIVNSIKKRIFTKRHVRNFHCEMWMTSRICFYFIRRSQTRALTAEACMPCLKMRQHQLSGLCFELGMPGNPAKGQRLMMTHATHATLRAAEWQLHVPRQISTHSPTVCNRIWFACIFFWQGPTNNHIESLRGSFAFGPMICNKSFW